MDSTTGIDDLEQEIADTRRKLIDLLHQAKRNAPLSKEPPRISITAPREIFEDLQALALRRNTSVSALGLLAVKHLLIQARAGALPMQPRSTLDNAQTITCLGEPLD